MNYYIVKSKKIITASDINGTIENGAMVIENGRIKDIGEYSFLKNEYKDLEVLDSSDFIITPSLVDCHTHLLEYALNLFIQLLMQLILWVEYHFY